MANHFPFFLQCRHNCPELTNNRAGEFTEDILASFYHYLQFGYYKCMYTSQLTGPRLLIQL